MLVVLFFVKQCKIWKNMIIKFTFNEDRQINTEFKAIQNTTYLEKAVEIKVCDIRNSKHQ